MHTLAAKYVHIVSAEFDQHNTWCELRDTVEPVTSARYPVDMDDAALG